ncbi:hypothetical protein [Gimesia aquarii]|uniref:Uncharacterized protein n=1 Tax=Gimesia aquarii TaxID=2527964 RepID=A0A517WRN9_9PLAN|nr:hypothetical protein [Gimesia aquarii]QDU07920.1 hypothetical protein V202x_12810 [Gimesia aquarii]
MKQSDYRHLEMLCNFLKIIVLCILCTGCASGWNQAAPLPASNPIQVSGTNQDVVWERVVDIIHNYKFQIARENKLDGMIQTEYKVGSNFLEPWHADSVGFDNKLESSLQSIRRRVFVSVTPIEGGYLLGVEAFKEIEDVHTQTSSAPGGATFEQDLSLRRDLNLVQEQAQPSGWIPRGRDPALEQDMLESLQAAFSN